MSTESGATKLANIFFLSSGIGNSALEPFPLGPDDLARLVYSSTVIQLVTDPSRQGVSSA